MTEPVAAGCSLAKGLGGTLGVAISPEGDNLYASGAGSHAEAAFARNTNTGALTLLAEPYECVTSDSSGCGAGSNEAAGLTGARRVTVSPDGTNVYLAGQGSSAIVELSRTFTPAVSAISPNSGPEVGGTAVAVSGSGFAAGATVAFGGRPASGATINSAGSITAISPPGSGTAEVTVANAAGTSAATAADRFSYASPPQNVVPAPVLAHTGNVAPVSGSRAGASCPAQTDVRAARHRLRQIPFGTGRQRDPRPGALSSTAPGLHGRHPTGRILRRRVHPLTQGS